MDWVYKQIIGFLANFFAEMGNMGAEMFEMSWVQSIVLFFSYLAWILYAVGFVVACAECGLEYSSGRADIKGTAMNLIKGFMAVSLFTVVPIRLYELCVSLQANFGYAISGAGASFGTVAGNIIDELTVENFVDFATTHVGGFNSVTSSLMVLFCIILMAYAVIKVFFAAAFCSFRLRSEVFICSASRADIWTDSTSGASRSWGFASRPFCRRRSSLQDCRCSMNTPCSASV